MPRFVSAAPEVRESSSHYRSGGKRISVEVFEPATVAPTPAIVVLHGAGGLMADSYLKRFAELLAGQNFTTFFVHYFDRTGSVYANDATINREFRTWLDTVRDAVPFVQAHPRVRGQKVGFFGYSLGAYLSMAAGVEDSKNIAAVVELAGGIPEPAKPKLQEMPPVLILHGADDRRVPVSEAYELEKLLKEKNLPYEMKIYEGEPHRLGFASIADALERGIAFFHRHLDAR